jgi:uncharacterized protein (TIGR02266 family)
VREPRYQVDISVDETTTSIFTAGRVTNISRGGLFIETPAAPPIDTPVDLALRLPEIRTVLNVHGRVAWTYDMKKGTTQLMTGAGIKFIDMTRDQLSMLEAYLTRLGPPERRPMAVSPSSP